MTDQAIPDTTTPSTDAGGGEPTAAERLEALRAALAAADAAAAPEARGRFLVLTHRGPDPDALGACEGVRLLLREHLGYEPLVATLGAIHRAENLALVQNLELDLAPYDDVERQRYAGVLLVDTQPEFGHTVVPDDLPVVAVFDHHVPPQVDGEGPSVALRDVRLDLGATCSMVWEYLHEAGVELDPRTASALFCGVRYDTADLSRNATELDERAYFETFRRADRAAVAAIEHPPLPSTYYAELGRALTRARRHGPLILALMGKVENPESVAEMADFFLRMEGCSWVLAGAAHGSEYIVSVRTAYGFGPAYPLLQRVLDGAGSFGGHGFIAGGRIRLESEGESCVKQVERALRKSALQVIGNSDEDGIPEEGRPVLD